MVKAITREIIFITFQLSSFALCIALTKLVFTFNCNVIDYLFCLYTLVDDWTWKEILFDSTGGKGTSPLVLYINWWRQNSRTRIKALVFISEMNITGTLPPLLLMAKSWSQILRDTSPRHACLGEVSRESASRQSRELIMRSERTTKVQRGGRRESQGRVNLPFV